MATGMTKTALVRTMAEKLELTNKQSAAFLDLLAETAVKETKKNGVFVIPGLGRLVKAERKARMGRNPQTGETIKIKAKTVVKFRVAKAAKDTIAPPRQEYDCGAGYREIPAYMRCWMARLRRAPGPRRAPSTPARAQRNTEHANSTRREPARADSAFRNVSAK